MGGCSHEGEERGGKEENGTMMNLKLCPFCGGKDIETITVDDEEYHYGQRIARCRDCDARGPSCNLDRKAQLLWDVRPEESKLKRQIDAIKKEYYQGSAMNFYLAVGSLLGLGIEKENGNVAVESCKTCKRRSTEKCDSPYPPADDDWCGAYRKKV